MSAEFARAERVALGEELNVQGRAQPHAAASKMTPGVQQVGSR
jgi:hypothetical protein